MKDEVRAIFEQIKALAPHERLRLASDLLERQRPDTAYAIADATVKELGAWLLLRRLEKKA